MPHPLEVGTIRILKTDGSTAGTGFLVSKRLAVTCAHVVDSANAKAGDVIEFEYHLGNVDIQEAKVLENGWSPENDVAVLELIEKPPKWIHPIIMQSSRAMEGRSFQGLGYPDDGPIQTRWPQGNISGRVEVKGYSNPLLQIQGKEIDKGLSGSALVDRSTRRVIGMITAYQDIARQSAAENVRFGYAIPIETLWKVYPELEKELPPLPKRSPLVEGIHLLPNGYDFRIQNFLTEYLGTPEQPEPFGGRDEALKTLENWLEGDSQRLLLAAPAGRGKSALLVRWLGRLLAREDLALVFVPVSVRFRTNLASTFFASFAARLAYLHGEDVPTSMEISTDVWRGLASTYLTKLLTDGKKILVVLDGLDEAGDWEATADLIPADLPGNVHVVVSVRFLAGDSDGQPWLSRLGWERKGTASILDLDPLDSSGIADVLLRMGVPLDELSRRVDIVTELHRLSEGDPLLVNLYVEDLWSRGEQASRLRPEDLGSIRSGYEGYFDRWWSDQKKLWGKETPLRGKSVRLVFNLLCGAMGGLTKDDLMALDPKKELNTYAIEEAFNALKRFVIGIPDERRKKEIGYVLSHPKLRDYFWDTLTEKERTELEARFVIWGEQTMQALIDEKLKPADTPRYLLQFYGAHMERSNAAIEILLPFVDNPHWQRAWYAYEGAYGGYLQDVKRVWKFAERIDQQVVERTGEAPLLGREIRCAILEASIHSLADNIPAELFVQIVQRRLWTLTRVWTYLRQTVDPLLQFDTFQSIVPFLSNTELVETLFILNQIVKEDGARYNIITKIIHHLPDEYLINVLTVAAEIKDEYLRMELIHQLVQRLPRGTVSETLVFVRQIKKESYRANALMALLNRFPELANDILAMAKEIEDEYPRAEVLRCLIELAPNISADLLTAACSIQDQGARIIVFAKTELEQYLTEKKPSDLLATSIKIKDEEQRAYVFFYLAKCMMEELLPRDILSAARLIENEWTRAQILCGIMWHLPDGASNEVLSIAKTIHGTDPLSRVLIELLRRFPESTEGVLDVVQVKDSFTLAMDVLRTLPSDLPERLLDKALDIVHSKDISWMVSSLAKRLSETQLIREFESANLREDPSGSSLILSSLIPYLPEIYLNKALDTARKNRDQKQRVRVLSASVKRYPEIFSEAMTESQKIHDNEACDRILGTLAKLRIKRTMIRMHHEYRGESSRLLIKVLGYVKNLVIGMLGHSVSKATDGPVNEMPSVRTNEERAASIVAQKKTASKKLLTKELMLARETESEWHRAEILTQLANRVPEEQLGEILAMAREMEDEEMRAKVLVGLAQRLPEATHDAFIATCQIWSGWERSSFLKKLVKQLKTMHKNEAFALWKQAIPRLALYTRKELLLDIEILLPFISRFGKYDVEDEVALAVLEITTWWP